MASRPLPDGTAAPARLGTSADAAELVLALDWPAEREAVAAIILDDKLSPIRTEWIGAGGAASTPVLTRHLLSLVMAEGASGVVLAHNHPSGCLNPSATDLRLTRELARVLKLVEVVLLDHLIVGAGRYLSMRDNGMV